MAYDVPRGQEDMDDLCGPSEKFKDLQLRGEMIHMID
jgi:hypothetical protein